MTDADRQRARRDRLRGGPPRVPAPHGTKAAALRHKRAKEPLCGPCAVAWAEHQAEMYRKRQERPSRDS